MEPQATSIERANRLRDLAVVAEEADCLGVINDAAEFALWLSPHILSNVARVLSEVLGLDGKHIDDYVHVLTDLAAASGGGLTDPPPNRGRLPGLGTQPDPRPGRRGRSTGDRLG